MPRWAERLIERAALAVFIGAGLAAYLVSHFIGDPPLGKIVSALAAFWAAAMLLLAVPHGLRFGDGPWGILSVGIALAALVVLPLLPWIALAGPRDGHPDLFFFFTVVVTVQIGGVVVWSFRNQGRYFGSDRELPDLEGEPRAAAEDVLRRAGLRPVSLRIAPLGTLNAFVMGWKTCVVVLDRNVGKLLEPEEIQALVAHEVGHVRAGGMFAGVLPVALTLTAANTAALLGWISNLDIVGFVGLFLCLRALLSQCLEVHCDRFATRLASAASTASMLRKVHVGQPRAIARLFSRRCMAPFLSHPPLDVRLASIGQGAPGALLAHRRAWFLVLLVFFLGPMGILVGSHAVGVELPAGIAWPARFLPAAFAVCAIFSLGLVQRRVRRFLPEKLGNVVRWSWLRVLFLCLGFACLGMILALSLELVAMEFVAACLLLWLSILVLVIVTETRRGWALRLSGRARKAIIEGQAALLEGKPEEALAIIDGALERARPHAWLLVNRAACLVNLGRLDEAAACLEGPLARKESFPTAALSTGFVELLRGNLARADEMTSAAAGEMPKQVLAWYLGGLVACEAGDLAKADERFARALAVKESDGRSLAGRAIAAMERGHTGPDVEAWLEEARRLEPLVPIVILAGARRRQVAGDLEGARREAGRAIERLRELGMQGWVPYFERLCHRWALVAATPWATT